MGTRWLGAVLCALATIAILVGILNVLTADAGATATMAVLVIAVAAGSYAWGRWIAVLSLGALLWAVPSLLADLAWATGVWDRSSEYEPLPLSMFVLPLGVPLFCFAAATGVLLRRARQPTTTSSTRAPSLW